VSLVLGGLACVLPLARFELTDMRAYICLAFALLGLLVGLIGSSGRRRGNAAAMAGSFLCVTALVLAAVILIGTSHAPTENRGDGDHTQEILREELDVHLGQWRTDAHGYVLVTVTLHNKGPETASFGVTIELNDSEADKPCEDGAYVDDLAPGASYQATVDSCSSEPEDVTLQVTKVSKE
jgi:hypothetical protein